MANDRVKPNNPTLMNYLYEESGYGIVVATHTILYNFFVALVILKIIFSTLVSCFVSHHKNVIFVITNATKTIKYTDDMWCDNFTLTKSLLLTPKFDCSSNHQTTSQNLHN